MEFTPQYNDKRREAARKGMSKLRAARKREVEALMAQIENLEGVLGHLKAHPEERHRGINQFVVTRRILDQRNSALKAQVLACNRLIQLLRSWTISRQLYNGYVETHVPHDAGSRRSGFDWLTKKAYNMSLKANEYIPKRKDVADDTKVKLHLGVDENGAQSVLAFECQIQFTIFANYENVAKTWWFDLLESAPLLQSTVVEKVGDHIVYVKQEHVDLNYRRLCLAAVFLDHEKDRITITQTGIAMDDRFPFQGGESRSNGFQWIVFQHVTDNVTIVRWSILSFCPVNAKGPLSLRDMAARCGCTYDITTRIFPIERIIVIQTLH
ncbi:unnamed protein product [Aphanomyces euteiches]|uniref:START domain-containing protein n=1 Tax=Aphanomyces euteiches TaxID=100861 RepID=A0A6G0W4P0_9STRA|nr:hypothetical protein Ae201684_018972 [Aphanomyces euteiches]KAH9147512.1 hypothetical protein AeRB84_008903 [Aphanomyces euteiches]KAH9149641.1 hypothetical protein AeRB84_007360 [Aphanomyces euteiches]